MAWRCEVYFKSEGTFLFGYAPIPDKASYWRFHEPILVLGPEPTPEALGRAVRQVLDRPVPEPAGSKDTLDFTSGKALRAVGIKGWSGLQSSSRSFLVEDEGTRVKITAYPLEPATCAREPGEIGRLLLELRPRCPVSAPLTPPRPGSSYSRRSGQAAISGGIPQTFGYKTDWLVIDTTDAAAVVSALGLKNVRPATWDINPYGPDGVFVSPSVLGWTYVLDTWREPGSPEFAPLLEDLSRRFGEVQYFGTYRVVGFHAWVKAVDGRIVRGYWVSDDGVTDIGELTPEEQELGFANFVNSQTADGDWDEIGYPGEEDVMRIAGRWSINPQELDAYDSKGPGFLGRRT